MGRALGTLGCCLALLPLLRLPLLPAARGSPPRLRLSGGPAAAGTVLRRGGGSCLLLGAATGGQPFPSLPFPGRCPPARSLHALLAATLPLRVPPATASLRMFPYLLGFANDSTKVMAQGHLAVAAVVRGPFACRQKNQLPFLMQSWPYCPRNLDNPSLPVSISKNIAISDSQKDQAAEKLLFS